MIPAVVLGLDTMQGLQTARILARRGVPVFGYVNHSSSYAARTNVCRQVFGLDESEDLVEHLCSLDFGCKPVLIPCQDGKVLTVSRNRDRLARHFEFVLPEAATVEMMMDKTSFYRYARIHGFPIPPTFFVADRRQAETAAAQVPYPAVIKPSYRSTGWTSNTTAKAFQVASAEQLLDEYDRIGGWCEELIVQGWVEGQVSDLYSCNAYIGRDGEPLATFVARKLRQWPPDTGQSSLGESCRNDRVLAETLRLAREVDYRGLLYVEMKRHPGTGEHFIIEPNVGRPTGRSAIAEGGGVELLYTVYCDALGMELPTARTQDYRPVKWIHLRRDLQSAAVAWRRGELDLKGWWRSVRGEKVYAIWSWRDPRPFFWDVWEAVRAGMSSTQRKRRTW